jgi:choline kinase
MEEFPDVFYKYNPFYYVTNTSKSLLAGINDLNDDVMWANGDVIFDENIVQDIISFNGNVVSVNKAACGEEEVKYRTDCNGKICEISKIVDKPEGEAVGINKICRKDLAIFKDALRTCDDNDYFERGLEIIIQKNITIRPLDVSNYKCIEVDFEDDWKRALDLFP